MKSMTSKDFCLEWFSGRGAGGQHRNKHQNCCRITHVESGLVATGQRSRSRVENQRAAFTALVGKLFAYYEGDTPSRRQTNNVVRTYHFERNVATDGSISKPVAQVMDGDIDDFIARALNGQRNPKYTGRV
jgi:protein subunit release factor A